MAWTFVGGLILFLLSLFVSVIVNARTGVGRWVNYLRPSYGRSRLTERLEWGWFYWFLSIASGLSSSVVWLWSWPNLIGIGVPIQAVIGFVLSMIAPVVLFMQDMRSYGHRHGLRSLIIHPISHILGGFALMYAGATWLVLGLGLLMFLGALLSRRFACLGLIDEMVDDDVMTSNSYRDQ